MNDDDILAILFNKSKTKAFLSRAKVTHPDKWGRIFGNMRMAYEELSEHQVHKSFFTIGVYDPNQNDSWPWHFHYSEGIYLSQKWRLCKIQKAIEFDDVESAREHFHQWSGSSKYKMEIIEHKKWVSVSLSESLLTGQDWQLKKPKLTSTKTNGQGPKF